MTAPSLPGSPSDSEPRWVRRRGILLLLAGTIIAAWLGAALPTLACRYNVRDVGFVDLEGDSYRFYWYLPATLDPAIRASLEGASSEAFQNANLRVEWIRDDPNDAHPALAHRPSGVPGSMPCGSLVSPDGQTLPLALDRQTLANPTELRARLENLVASPLREALLSAALHSFGAILIIEGTEDTANRLARRTVDEAIEAIRQQMPSLPKAIAAPPAAVVLDLASQARERVLLWSLGISPPPAAGPRAAVVYGRARWIGPLMETAEISVRNLSGIFSIIGADCECGLDLSWTQGTRLPIRWTDPIHEQAARLLGFDPENPLVKHEVTWIVGRQHAPEASSAPPPSATPAPTTPSPLPTATNETAAATAPGSSPPIHHPVAGLPQSPSPLSSSPDAPLSTAPVPRAIALGMAAATLVAGLWLWLRAKGR